MRRFIVFVAALAAATALTAGLASSAGAYGGGSSHDTWQVGFSFNCDNPSFCGDNLGGFWGWYEFDRAADGTITGDAQLAGCGHSVGGGGPGSAGAGHLSLDITAAHIGPGGPNDPPGDVFYIDHNVATFTGHGAPPPMVDDPDFLGDSGVPVTAGHYSLHPAPGVSMNIQVSYRAAH